MNWFRRRSPDDGLTQAQRERLLVVGAGASPDAPERWLTQCRLESTRWLVESGRIGKDDGEVTDER